MLFYYLLMIIISYLIEIRYSNELKHHHLHSEEDYLQQKHQQQLQSLMNTINFELYK